ncbi:MAG: Uma2 family endonuclease [Bacteroidota bacterium]
MSVLLSAQVGIDEFLEQELASEERHEYYNGKITLIAYASDNHELIVANIVGELRNYFKDKPYRVYPSNRMLYIPTTERFYYADAMVVKGKPEFLDYKKKMKATLNPCTIIEVLSESTEGKDRGEKWQGYRTIPSLQEYVLIAQDQVYVEVFRKMENEGQEELWLNEYHNQLDKSVEIAEQTILLSEIYRDVDFSFSEEK